MRIVDKYGLKELEKGTSFFQLDTNEMTKGETNRFINNTLMFLDDKGKTSLNIGKTNGGTFMNKIRLVSIEDELDDFSDNDKFLVISPIEFEDLLGLLNDTVKILGE